MTRSLLLITLLLVLAGCGGGDDGDSPGTAGQDEPTSAEADDSADDASGNATIAERGSITIASAFLPQTLDPAQHGFNLITFGTSETLTRVLPDQTIEPWLAESVEPIDDTTWEIVLRDDVTFWDGERMTSDHVVESIERAWAEQASTARFLPEETVLDLVDEDTLRLTLPEPDSSLPHNLATFQLLIYKLDGDDAIMTGPYRPVSLRTDEELVLEANDDYWGGVPALERITVRRVIDGNARMLAVQSGDVDISMNAAPETAASISGDVALVSVASTRVHYVMLNHNRAPFDDPAVRRAVNRATDRDQLNDVALGGLAEPLSSIIPPELGVPTPERLALDVDAAEETLEDAGWVVGDDGVRSKDGVRLGFTLLSYPQRPELTAMAVSIQDQLGRIGFDVSVQEVDDITSAIDGTDFQASMYSIDMLPTGDPHYALNTVMLSDGIYNYGGYQNVEFDDLLSEIQRTLDPDERADLILQAQQIIADDDAAIFLVAAPKAVLYRPDRVEDPSIYPSDLYFIAAEHPRLAQ